MKMLIIDDSRAARSILKTIVKSIGADSIEAKDGKDALDQLAVNGPVDLALVDWNMPVMDGYEFVKAVRADSRYDGMLLMMVTAETEMEQVAKALEAGANEFVMKPFTKEVLLEKLELLGIVVSAG